MKFSYRPLQYGVLPLALCWAAAAPAAAVQPDWIPTWTASPQRGLPGPEGGAVPALGGRTVRERMRVSLGGHQVRLRLSNAFGDAPLKIGAITIARPKGIDDVEAATIVPVTFGGRPSATIPTGAPLLSDPVSFPVADGAEVSVSIYFPQAVPTPTLHSLGLKTAVVTPPGDHTAEAHVDRAGTTTASLLVSAIMVPTEASAVVVAFGDSITDGNNATLDQDRNWPDDFARRMAQGSPEERRIAIVNEAISGNRLLRDLAGVSALARFDRDVLSLPGVTHVVILEGINDLGFPGARMGNRVLENPADLPGAEDLIGAYKQLIERAHLHGIKVIGSTLTPWEGTDLPGYYTPEKEKIRQAVNVWIRTSGAFDAVIDFDAVLRDPNRPAHAQPHLISPDNLHPNNAGYQAMADAVSSALFLTGPNSPHSTRR